MSRIGNKPIIVPDGVEVKVDGQKITVKGPKGMPGPKSRMRTTT